MIRRKQDIPKREIKNAQGGKGSVYFYDWLPAAEAPGHGRVFSKVVIPAGCSIAPHPHQGEFEAFYVLSGVATVTDGETADTAVVETLLPGDMNLCRDGCIHGVENRGEEDLELLALIMNTL